MEVSLSMLLYKARSRYCFLDGIFAVDGAFTIGTFRYSSIHGGEMALIT